MCSQPSSSRWSERAADAAGKPLLQSPSNWAGLPIDMYVIPASAERGRRVFADAMVQVAVHGSGIREYICGNVHRKLSTAPRMIEVYGAGFQIDQARWDGTTGCCVAISLPQVRVAAMFRDDTRRLELQTRHEVFDDRLSQVVLALASEARSGAANGPLFAEGLSLALVGLLLQHYSARSRSPARRRTGLSATEEQRVRDFIETNLAQDLTLERLAITAGMSGFQFLRRFRASFGVSPHQYVLRRRLESATVALRTRADLSIADIATHFGFASPSHFTYAFRRHTGETPATVRRG